MRLSLHTDFALRTLMFLAGRQERASVAEIAEFFDVSRDHLAKVVQRLSREGYVRSMRGVGGGVELARPAEDIELGEVIERFEGSMHLLDCVAIENVCVIQPGCKLKHVLAEAERIQVEYLKSVRLADVVQVGEDLVQLTK
ncbi:MAG: Rrf2 family transcriptional regulator [Planctomycetaceae bacterium]|nr:Rrf2 family transcriptional regulator [Planctomycetaceae bacterium]